MRKLFFILATFTLTTSLAAAACTKTSGPSRPESAAEFVTQVREPVADQADRDQAAEPAPEQTPDNAQKGVRFAVVSDLNSSYGSTDYSDEVHQAVRWIIDEVEPDAVLSTGDMVAGQRKGLDYQAMWQGFHDAVTRPLGAAGIPLMVTPGNHDASAGSVYMEERITYVEQWKRHRPEVTFVDDSFYPLYYAFEIGPALFISLDATITGPIDDAQRKWLEEVLEKHEHKETKVVFGHVPLYPFTEERKSESLADEKLEELLVEQGVDLMLTGHHHAYYPGRRDSLRLVSMACVGSGPRTLIGDDKKSQKSVAVIDISPNGDISVEAYHALDHSKIERESLPEHLNDGKWRIWRDDLEKTTN